MTKKIIFTKIEYGIVMENRNYNFEMMKTVNSFADGEKPRLLLHSCCGPCTTAVLERLAPYFTVTLFYYNPNTRPYAEYVKRMDTLREFLDKASYSIPVIVGEYEDKLYDGIVSPFHDEKEDGERCAACIKLRLSKTAEEAAKRGFDYFASTLSVSPMKNAAMINGIGEELAKIYRVKYLVNDFKKNGGSKRSVELSKGYNLYRQDYCGCEMSEKIREKK